MTTDRLPGARVAVAAAEATGSRGVSIVVPNWNGEKLLARNLPHVVAAADRYSGPAEVVVVDDGSTDGSTALIETEFPAVRLVKHPVNRGFGPACLSGVEAAREELVILLNSDVRPLPDAVEPLVGHFSDDDVFAVAPLVTNEAGDLAENIVNAPYLKRGMIHFRKIPRSLVASPQAPNPPIATLFATGGAIAMRRSRFLEFGGFHPIYQPFYHEDTDLGFRAWRHGWATVVEPRSRFVHQGSSTIGRLFSSVRIKTIRRRNRFLLHWIHLQEPAHLASHIGQIALKVLYKWLRLDWVFYGGLYLSLFRLPAAWRVRRAERISSGLTETAIFQRIADTLPRLEPEGGRPDGGADSGKGVRSLF